MPLSPRDADVDGDSSRGSSSDTQSEFADTRGKASAAAGAATGGGAARAAPPPLLRSAAMPALTAPVSGPARRRACPSATQTRNWGQRGADTTAAAVHREGAEEEGDGATAGAATAAGADDAGLRTDGPVRRVASASLGSTASSASPFSRNGMQRGPRAAVLARLPVPDALSLKRHSIGESSADASASLPAAAPVSEAVQPRDERLESSTDTVDVAFPPSACPSSLRTTPTAASRSGGRCGDSAGQLHVDPGGAPRLLPGLCTAAAEKGGRAEGSPAQPDVRPAGSSVQGSAVSSASPSPPPPPPITVQVALPPSIISSSCSLARVVQLLAQSGSSSPPHTPRQQLRDAEVWVRQVWEEQRLLQAQLAVAEAKTAALALELQTTRRPSALDPTQRDSVDTPGNSTKEFTPHAPPPAVVQTARGSQSTEERLAALVSPVGGASDVAKDDGGERAAAYTAELEAYVRRLEQHTHALRSEKQQLQLRLDHRTGQLAAAQERYTRLQSEQAVLEGDYRRAAEDVEEVVSLLVVARAAERAAMRRVEEMELAVAASERRADALATAAAALDGPSGGGAGEDRDGVGVGFTAEGAIQLASWRRHDPQSDNRSGAHDDGAEYDHDLVPGSSGFASFMEVATEYGAATPRPMSERPLMSMASSRTRSGGGGLRTHSATASATHRIGASLTVMTPVHGSWAAEGTGVSPSPPLLQPHSRPASSAVALAAALDAEVDDESEAAGAPSPASTEGAAAATPPSVGPPAVPPLPLRDLMQRHSMPRTATPANGASQRTQRGNEDDGSGLRSKQLGLPQPRRDAADDAGVPTSPRSSSVSVSSLLSPLVSTVTALLTPRSLAQQRRQVQHQFHTLRSARGAEGERVEESELLRFRCTLLELELQGKEAAHRAEREAWEASVRHAEGVAGAMGEVEARVRQATAASEKVKGLLHEMSRLWASALTLDDDEDSEDDLLGSLATPPLV